MEVRVTFDLDASNLITVRSYTGSLESTDVSRCEVKEGNAMHPDVS